MFSIRFWGVRGSRVVAKPNFMKYGGNTTCLDICVEGKHFIFDAGTGFSELGEHINDSQDIFVFFTHYHHDHINGICFFRPYFKKGCHISFYGALHSGLNVRDMFEQRFLKSYFPVSKKDFFADVDFFDIKADDEIYFCDNRVKISTFNLVHPSGCICYKFEYNGKKVVFCTDTDVFVDKQKNDFIDFVKNSDILIFDGATAIDDYKKGWGHSNINEAIDIYIKSDVKKMILTHYETSYDDDYLDILQKKLSKEYTGIFLAKEGMQVEL